jgi:anaerobic ribonucleoside-triphosphate reductase
MMMIEILMRNALFYDALFVLIWRYWREILTDNGLKFAVLTLSRSVCCDTPMDIEDFFDIIYQLEKVDGVDRYCGYYSEYIALVIMGC